MEYALPDLGSCRPIRTCGGKKNNRVVRSVSCRMLCTSLMYTLWVSILTQFGGELHRQAQLISQSISGYRQVKGACDAGLGLTQTPSSSFTDTFETNCITYPRTVCGYQPYEGKYGPTRFDGLKLYGRNMLIHHRIAKHDPLVWSGYLDGGDMTALNMNSPHVFVST